MVDRRTSVRGLAFAICALLTVALGKLGLTIALDDTVQAAQPVVAFVPQTAQVPPTTTSTTSTTTTTLPRPVVTAPKPPPPSPPPAPTSPAVAAPAASVSGGSLAERCAEALSWAKAHGLHLPAGWGYRCPDPAVGEGGDAHWGTACMNMPNACPATAYVAVNIEAIGSNQSWVHYVVAHEICHAIELVTTGSTTEPSADACAAAHGAPRP